MIGLLIAAMLFFTALALPAAAQPTNPVAVANHTAEISLMAVTDVHGTANNWDYMTNAEYTGVGWGNGIRGLARISTLAEQVRAERGDEATLLFDIGDTIQGTMLAAYYAQREPITEGSIHPMALAMNAIGFDSMTVGNHEFNFGLPHLLEFERQLDAPLLAANALYAGTDQLAFQPYVILTVKLKGEKPIRVGVLGLTHPDSAVWDRGHLEGVLEFDGALETAQEYVPEMRAKGADVVVVAVHGSGTAIAEQVPGIDVVFPGHSHSTNAQQFVTNEVTGEQVLISQAGSHAQNLSVVDLTLYKERGQWNVIDKSSYLLRSRDVDDDPMVIDLLDVQHQTVVDYVNTPIGNTPVDLSLTQAAYMDVPGVDLINYVQAAAVNEGMTGTAYDDLPVLAITAPLNSSANIPAGEVSIRDIGALYFYENTLDGVILNGSQIEDYLEKAAGYFDTVTSAGPMPPGDVGSGGYCYDVIYGLTYDIDLSESAGNRIENLSYDGALIDPAAEFVLGINNYRHGGGCSYPHVTAAPDVLQLSPDIQGLLIQYLQDQETLDDTVFASVDWQLTYQDTPIVIAP